MIRSPLTVLVCATVAFAQPALAALIIYNSPTNADNATVRSNFY